MKKNPHQSDETVKIYHTVSGTINTDCIYTDRVDPLGALSRRLSDEFEQQWLLQNNHGDLTSDNFHSDYIKTSRQVADSYVSVILINPCRFCQTPADVEDLTTSILSINRVLDRKVLFLVDKGKGDKIWSTYRDEINNFDDSPTHKLATTKKLEHLELDPVYQAIRNWLSKM